MYWTLEVAPGEHRVFGFLGPNGAGKSTTIKILCTLTAPSGGTAEVSGFDVARQRDEVRRHIGLVFQDTTLDDYLSAEQNLRFHAELYGLPRAVVAPRMAQVFEMVGLADRRQSLVVGTFSGGMKRRLEIARGLMHSPRVLFLDEPTVGLDPQTRSHIWAYINELKKREAITMFLTTHYMDEAEHCDRIAIIDGGRLVALRHTGEALKAAQWARTWCRSAPPTTRRPWPRCASGSRSRPASTRAPSASPWRRESASSRASSPSSACPSAR